MDKEGIGLTYLEKIFPELSDAKQKGPNKMK